MGSVAKMATSAPKSASRVVPFFAILTLFIPLLLILWKYLSSSSSNRVVCTGSGRRLTSSSPKGTEQPPKLEAVPELLPTLTAEVKPFDLSTIKVEGERPEEVRKRS